MNYINITYYIYKIVISPKIGWTSDGCVSCGSNSGLRVRASVCACVRVLDNKIIFMQ